VSDIATIGIETCNRECRDLLTNPKLGHCDLKLGHYDLLKLASSVTAHGRLCEVMHGRPQFFSHLRTIIYILKLFVTLRTK